MRAIAKPTFLVQEVLKSCISNMLDKSRVSNYNSISSILIRLTNDYENKANSQTLNTFPVHTSIGAVGKNELLKLYDNKLSKLGQPPRNYYDLIKSSAKLGICPLCAERIVSEVDHFLPKADFPGLCISPMNLIPACKDCNQGKKKYNPINAKDVHLHPYYDDVSKEQWLFASIASREPLIIEYKISHIPSWQLVANQRLDSHFEVFDLFKFYSQMAGVEIQSLGSLSKVHAIGGKSKVMEHLNFSYEGLLSSKGKNHWRTTLYQTLSTSEWFCNEGVYKLKNEL